MKKILLLLVISGITTTIATAQNTTTTPITGAAPIYNGSANSLSNTTNRTVQPVSSQAKNNDVNSSYRSHYQPTTTKSGTITPQTPTTTPNSAVPGAPTNTNPPPISK